LVADKSICKSVFFSGILRRLFGELHRAIQATVLEGKFSLDMFLGAVYGCFNEAGDLSDAAKLLSRQLHQGRLSRRRGKWRQARTIHDLARIAITTNKLDFNITASYVETGSEERLVYCILGHLERRNGDYRADLRSFLRRSVYAASKAAVS
jgi:hypothetical protein